MHDSCSLLVNPLPPPWPLPASLPPVQDFRLSEMFANAGKGVVVVVNKWDKVDPEVWTIEKMTENVQVQLREVSWAKVVCTSANRGELPVCVCVLW